MTDVPVRGYERRGPRPPIHGRTPLRARGHGNVRLYKSARTRPTPTARHPRASRGHVTVVRAHQRRGRPVRQHLRRQARARRVQYAVRNGLSVALDPEDNYGRVAEAWFGKLYDRDGMRGVPRSVRGADDFLITSVFVDSDYERRGLGRKVVENAEADMRRQGAQTIYLDDVVPPAWGFWTKLGYERAPFSTPFFIHDRGDTWVKRL